MTLVFEGLDITDDKILAPLFSSLPDAVPALINGVTTVSADIEAVDEVSAAFQLADAVAQVAPEATAIRVDQDLVSIPDISERTDRTRESVRLLVEGKRGPGGFPAPIGTVGDGIRVWPWAAVVGWFRRAVSEDIGEWPVTPEAAAFVDYCLAARRQLRETSVVLQAYGPREQRSADDLFRQEAMFQSGPRSGTLAPTPVAV